MERGKFRRPLLAFALWTWCMQLVWATDSAVEYTCADFTDCQTCVAAAENCLWDTAYEDKPCRDKAWASLSKSTVFLYCNDIPPQTTYARPYVRHTITMSGITEQELPNTVGTYYSSLLLERLYVENTVSVGGITGVNTDWDVEYHIQTLDTWETITHIGLMNVQQALQWNLQADLGIPITVDPDFARRVIADA